MTAAIADEDGKASSKEFEMEFGHWCMRSTLDIIGYVCTALCSFRPNRDAVSPALAVSSARYKTQKTLSSSNIR